MAYRFNCELSGWGSIRNPLDSNERLTVEDGEIVVKDGDLAAAIDEAYGALTLVEEPDADESNGDAFDAESFLDRVPMTDVIEDIESGEADDHLDALAEQAGRQGVQDAIADRQDEL